jgi:hypothetical protein
MKTMLLGSAVALSFAVGPAYADGGGQATTFFTMVQDQKPAAPAHVVPARSADEATHNYVTRSNQGTWLFPANSGEGGNN